MKSKLSLNEAVQVGPWRVARKHLLFVIVFGLAIIAFGLIVIHSHVFNQRGDNEEGNDEEEEEGEEEGDEEWGEVRKKFTGGDWVMIAIMTASGLLSLLAIFACAMVKKNAPRRISNAGSPQNAPIYSVQFNGNNASKLPSTSAQSVTTSQQQQQQIPIWSGQFAQSFIQNSQSQPHLQIRSLIPNQSSGAQPILTLPRLFTAQPQQQLRVSSTPSKQTTTSNIKNKRKVGEPSSHTSNRTQAENPPPYSP